MSKSIENRVLCRYLTAKSPFQEFTELAHRKGDRDYIALADALEKGDRKLADMYFQILRSKRNLHDVPESILEDLTLRHHRTA